MPLSIQSPRKARRSSRSFTHDPKGFKDGYATEDHRTGTFPITMELPICSNSADITTRPFMAFCTSFRVVSTISISLLNLISSCVSTVFMDSSYLNHQEEEGDDEEGEVEDEEEQENRKSYQFVKPEDARDKE